MATKADLRNRALKEMGVLAAGETASAEDAADVEQKIDEFHDMLTAKGLVTWPASDIPTEMMPPMTFLIADQCAGMFNLPADRRTELALRGVQAMHDLRALVAKENNGEPVRALYY